MKTTPKAKKFLRDLFWGLVCLGMVLAAAWYLIQDIREDPLCQNLPYCEIKHDGWTEIRTVNNTYYQPVLKGPNPDKPIPFKQYDGVI